MSLRDQIDALATRISQEMLKKAPQHLPSYATGKLQNRYDPTKNVYNLKESNMRKAHAGLVKAQNGGKMNILFLGDSTGLGYNGSVYKDINAAPRKMANFIAGALGVYTSGTGIVPAVAGGYSTNDRWSAFTGTTDAGTYPGYLTFFAGSSATYTSQQAGTTVEVYYSNLSASFTINIDGGSAITIPAGNGSGTVAKWTSSTLSDQNHTIKINAPNNYVFLTALAVVSPLPGITAHNMSYGGSTAAYGGPSASWTDTSTVTSVNGSRRGTLNAAGANPDLVVISIGANDIFQGDNVANAIAGITTMRNWYPNADVVLMQTWEVTGTNATTWNNYCAAKYALADTLDVPFVDFRDRTGLAAVAKTNGWVGADDIHATDGANMEFGRILALCTAGAAVNETPRISIVPAGTSSSGYPDGMFVEYTP